MGAEGERNIEMVNSWIIGLVFFVCILVSIIFEQALHHLEHWLGGGHGNRDHSHKSNLHGGHDSDTEEDDHHMHHANAAKGHDLLLEEEEDEIEAEYEWRVASMSPHPEVYKKPSATGGEEKEAKKDEGAEKPVAVVSRGGPSSRNLSRGGPSTRSSLESQSSFKIKRKVTRTEKLRAAQAVHNAELDRKIQEKMKLLSGKIEGLDLMVDEKHKKHATPAAHGAGAAHGHGRGHGHANGLVAVLHVLKDEFMLVGFLSLLLVITEDYLLAACRPVDLSWIPLKRTDCNVDCTKNVMTQTIGCHQGAACPGVKLLTGETIDAPACDVNGLPPTTAAYANASTRRLAAAASGGSWAGRISAEDVLGRSGSCPPGQMHFIEAKALHDIHILIFLLAVLHAAYSMIIMAIAKCQVRLWKKWEVWGDDDDETIDKLVKPVQRKSTASWYFWSFLRHLSPKTLVEPFTFISMKRYYIARHHVEPDFDFYEHVSDKLEHDFAELVGIRFWMWLVMLLQMLFEGKETTVGGLSTMGLIVVSLVIGTKLKMVADQLAADLYAHFDTNNDGMDEDELKQLQGSMHDRLIGIEPKFWFNKAEFLKIFIQFMIWQNSQNFMLLIFAGMKYTWDGSCYIQSRGMSRAIFSLTIFALMAVYIGFVVFPLYSLVSHSGSHQVASAWVRKLQNIEHGITHRFHDIDEFACSGVNKFVNSGLKGLDLTTQLTAKGAKLVEVGALHAVHDVAHAAHGVAHATDSLVHHHSSHLHLSPVVASKIKKKEGEEEEEEATKKKSGLVEVKRRKKSNGAGCCGCGRKSEKVVPEEPVSPEVASRRASVAVHAKELNDLIAERKRQRFSSAHR